MGLQSELFARHCEERSKSAFADLFRDEAIQSFFLTSKTWIASSLRLSKTRNALLAMTVTASMGGLGTPVHAQGQPDSENGRYSMSRVADGVLRLDTKTGAVSTCTNKGTGWACYAIPDERAAFDTEIGRLQKENEGLRAQLAARPPLAPKTEEALPKTDPLVPSLPKSADGERKIEIPLPSDKDLDRVMGFLENAWKRLVDMAARMQRDTSGKI